ncbi:hypothetical protein LTR74_006020 [Friedmanniomyces endolithicus]|nr:hypothetical protein LTR74_006020 [Friedmanniomyces endolithicus]
MTSAISPSVQQPPHAISATPTASGTTSPLPGAVPAQLPARSYATATKTASPAPPTPAGASSQNAKSTESPVNGGTPTAHGGSQPNGTTAAQAEHGKKPSVVISAAGASGTIPNGGPVSANGRPNILFGAMNASPLPQHSASHQSQTSSLSTPHGDPRVISPSHSPSPIPRPQASGGRPPSGLQNQTNGMTFGQLGGEGDQFRQQQPPLGPGVPNHERQPSSQSMHGDRAQQNMHSQYINPAGRGRGFSQQHLGPGGMPSPGANYRQVQSQQLPRQNMHPQFQQQATMPPSPYARNSSPAITHQRPNMPQYGYPPQQQVNIPFPSATTLASRCVSATSFEHASPSSHAVDSPVQRLANLAIDVASCAAPKRPHEHSLTSISTQMSYQGQYDPYQGYYQPYYGQQYAGPPPQSPRPPYPSPYNAPQSGMQPPFNPPDMSRSASQSSQRPPSSLGHPQTPAQSNQGPPSQTPVPQSQHSSAFVRPKKVTSAIKITDASGNEISFGKPLPAPSTQAQPQTPVIVSTPNAPTPPPRVPSGQHNRTETKPAKSSEETKNAFLEQVKRQVEEQNRREQGEKDAKLKTDKDDNDAKLKTEKDEKDHAEAKVTADKAAADKTAADKITADKTAADKAASDKAEADAKVQAEKDAADAKAKSEKDAADAKAKSEKEEADAKAQKDEADAKAKAEQDEADVKVKEREQAEAAAADQVKQATADAEKAAATAASDKKGVEDAEAAKKATEKADGEKDSKEETEDERLEREIAEMEAAEKEEEAREKAYDEKRLREKEEVAKRKASDMDAELKRQEREAEKLEEEREAEREAGKRKTEEPDQESKDRFAELKKPTIGPGASAPESGAETPASEDTRSATPVEPVAVDPPAQPSAATQARAAGAQKPKPAHLKLETNKRVEPAEPTPGMQALKSARFLEIKEDAKYPDGFKSPNPALNQGGSKMGRAYDRDFLMQFQSVFKEKPTVDWDQKVKDTLGSGDEPGSARTASARTPGVRQVSGRPGAGMQPMQGFGVMGQFGGQGAPRGMLPPGTTSTDRFAASSQTGNRATPAQMNRIPSQLGMGAPGMGMSRTNSVQTMAGMGGPNSPRQPSVRGGKGGPSKRGDRNMSKREEADMASKMPLTAHMDLAPLEKSKTGWKPTSIGQPAMSGPDPSGNMAPDLVQRKVKAALNKMTPENFEKITDQILEIAGQSKSEPDGRTLRQVIQLTFEKACDEAHWAGMYAKFCSKMLSSMSTDIRDEGLLDKSGNAVAGGALFRKYLLTRCQDEFERGWQANLPEKPEGDSTEAALLSDDYYIAAAAKRRGLGLIQFIGQLYKLRMLTLRIMHECVMRLLDFEGDPDEVAVENLTTLLKAVGSMMDEDENGHGLMSTYFQRINEALLKSDKLGSRPRFMIMDLIDLRKKGWAGTDGAKGPKTLDEIHQEAAAAQAKAEMERNRPNQRGGPGGGRPQAGRGDARNFSGNMAPPPVDYNRNVGMDDLRRLQNRNSSQRAGGGLGPGGSLGPSTLSGRNGSKRGNLGPPSSGNTTRTNTPPVEKEKKEEAPAQQNTFSALAALDPSGEDASGDQASPPSARNRSKSPLPAEPASEAA